VLPDGSVSVPVIEEETILVKRPVVKERVIIRKKSGTHRKRLTETRRREQVEITGPTE
jgi:uncharacterized protein (TIGR02271 family)